MTTSEQFALVLRTIYPGAAEAHAARAALQSIEEQVEFHKAAAAQNRDAYSRLFGQYEDLREQFAAERQFADKFQDELARTKEQLETAQRERDEYRDDARSWMTGFKETKEQLEAADVALDWIAQNHRRVILEMPSDIFQALRKASVSSPASDLIPGTTTRRDVLSTPLTDDSSPAKERDA